MLTKHEIFKDVHGVEIGTVSAALEEALTICGDAKYIREMLVQFQNGDIDEFELMDEITSYAVFDYNNLSVCKTCAASVNQVVNKYLKQVLANLGVFSENLSCATDCVFQIGDDELQTLIDQAYNVVSGMVFFVMVEFNVFSLIGATTSDYEIDEVFDGYCRKNQLDPIAEADKLLALSKEYKMRIDLFDSCPELEDQFYIIMGPNVIGIDFSMLTLDMVRDVLSGDITPEELVAQFQISVESEGDSE